MEKKRKEIIDNVILTIEFAFVHALKYYEGCEGGNVPKAVESINKISMNTQNTLLEKMKKDNLSKDEQKEYMDYYGEKLLDLLNKYFGDDGIITKNDKGE